jgi:hypothetical protein
MLEWQRSTKCEQGACVEVAWQRSTKCADLQCVEVGWARSTGCDGGTCVEVSQDNGLIGVRNSKIPGEVVWFDPDEWKAFIAGVEAGEFRFDA